MSEQSMKALGRANPVRLAGAAIRADVAVGKITVAQALEDPDVGVLQIQRLLCAQRGFGPSRSNALLRPLMIWPTRRVRDLTDRQKRLIVEALER